MLHMTLAISDFMMILLGAIVWAAAGLVAVMALALLAAGTACYSVRALWRRMRGSHG